MAKLIVGCGYLGSRVAARWLAAGDTVWVVTRSHQRAAELQAQGYRPLVADVLAPQSLQGLPECQTVLYAVGYDRSSGATIEQVYVDGLRHLLDALPHSTGKIAYASSTGVFGQSDGEWVDEQSPCQPTRPGGRACLAAEDLLRAHRLGPRSIVLRLAGLYGPGRIPNVADVRAGEPLAAPAEGYLNLIHVDDAATIVLAAEARAPLPSLYTVSDGDPVPRRHYYQRLAELLGAPAPQFVAPPADSAALARAASSKRVKNDRMLAELAVALAFPSYRQGLAAVVAGQS